MTAAGKHAFTAGPVRINSRKVDSRNGRARHEFAGDYHSDKFGVVFSCDALILNLTDGNRAWSVCFDKDATIKLAGRFAEFETGLTPRQLAERCKELEAALESIVDLTKPGQTVNVSQATDIICDVWTAARSALARATGGAA